MLVGYAYPAYECFKTVEKNKVGIEELRFWCQYWIIVAALTVFERVGDIFISWLPLYGEMKLTLFIFLWYPKTKGCGYVYTTLLRPFLAQHEKDVDQKLQEIRTRVWDSAFHYGQSCAQIGQIKLFEMVHYVIALSKKNEEKKYESEKEEENVQQANVPPKLKEHRSIKGISAPPPSPISSPSFQRASLKHRQLSEKKRPPFPSSSPTTLNRSMSQSSQLETAQVNRRADFTASQDEQSSSSSATGTEIDSGAGADQSLLAARSRLRRSSNGSQDM